MPYIRNIEFQTFNILELKKIMLYSIITFILVLNFTFLYLDDFKLSENKYLRFSQIISPLLILVLIILLYNELSAPLNGILFMTDSNNNNPNISIGATVEVSKEAATELSKGISNVGSNIGLAGSVAATTGGVAKVLSKAAIPPLQKAAIVAGASILGGAVHVGASAVNNMNRSRYNSSTYSKDTSRGSSGSGNSGTNANSFMDLSDPSGYTDLNLLIISIDIINYVCLFLVILLTMIILFKFYLNENKVNVNLNKLVGDRYNKVINHYVTKIIILNKKTSTVYIFAILFLLIFGLGFNSYFTTELTNNLDKFIATHLNTV